jgi:hypothetical protein
MRNRLLLVAVWSATPLLAHASTILVTNTGVDGASCGPASVPCRSISQGIANAAPGDRVLVGPGVYSDDLNGNGIFGEPGEEPNTISISKVVAVESSLGASATVIRKVSTPSGAVDIFSSKVRFGKIGKGFTLRLPGGVNSTGISVLTGATGVEVAGNVLTGPINIGFGAVNADPFIHDNRVICTASSAGIGFLLLPAPGTRLDRNSVESCDQAVVGGGTGVVLTRNLAIDNTGTGYNLGDFATFTKNAAISNGGVGLLLNSSSTPGTIASNTFANNDPSGNCGIQNDTGTSVTATGNFWGAATGPGPNPADQACNGSGSSTVTTPFATSDFTQAQSALR